MGEVYPTDIDRAEVFDVSPEPGVVRAYRVRLVLDVGRDSLERTSAR